MAFRLGAHATLARNVRARATDAIVDTLDLGTANSTAKIEIRDGSQPATPETTATGNVLVTINFANPAFDSADSTGTAGLAGGAAISATVTASGTAGWFRVYNRDNQAMFDGNISTSGADLNFDNVSFVSGGTATINSMTIQTPM